MTAPAERQIRWEAEGRRIAPTVDGLAAVVVAGDDTRAAGRLALGIAMHHSARRRVTIADLAGDVPVLQALIVGDDAHGISDAFQYGVSLALLARPAGVEPNLFILPSGADASLAAEMLASGRWDRFIGDVREDGGLLLFVAAANAAGLELLAVKCEGVVVAGKSDVAHALPNVLATAGRDTATSLASLPPRAIESTRSHRRWPWMVAALILVSAGGLWAARAIGTPAAGDGSERAGDDNAAAGNASGDSTPVMEVVNRTDSASAAVFGLELLAANTATGATLTLLTNAPYLPAPTIAPVQLTAEGARWFKLVAGAYTTRRSADSALAELRRQAIVTDSAGEVVRVPYALRLHAGLARASVPELLARYQQENVHAYALLQGDGRVHVYAGAFATPADATLLAANLRSANIEPTLAFRTGRVF